jgi:hypothetical protein
MPLATDAMKQGYRGTLEDLRAAFDAKMKSAHDLHQTMIETDLATDPSNLFRKISSYGGISEKSGEFDRLWQDSKNGGFRGIRGVLKRNGGKSVDEIIPHLAQDPEFSHIQYPEDLRRAIDDARLAKHEPSSLSDAAEGAGLRPGTKWWEKPVEDARPLEASGDDDIPSDLSDFIDQSAAEQAAADQAGEAAKSGPQGVVPKAAMSPEDKEAFMAKIEDLHNELGHPYGDRDDFSGFINTAPEDLNDEDLHSVYQDLLDLQGRKSTRVVKKSSQMGPTDRRQMVQPEGVIGQRASDVPEGADLAAQAEAANRRSPAMPDRRGFRVGGRRATDVPDVGPSGVVGTRSADEALQGDGVISEGLDRRSAPYNPDIIGERSGDVKLPGDTPLPTIISELPDRRSQPTPPGIIGERAGDLNPEQEALFQQASKQAQEYAEAEQLGIPPEELNSVGRAGYPTKDVPPGLFEQGPPGGEDIPPPAEPQPVPVKPAPKGPSPLSGGATEEPNWDEVLNPKAEQGYQLQYQDPKTGELVTDPTIHASHEEALTKGQAINKKANWVKRVDQPPTGPATLKVRAQQPMPPEVYAQKLAVFKGEPTIPGLEDVPQTENPTPKVAEEPGFSLTPENAQVKGVQGDLLQGKDVANDEAHWNTLATAWARYNGQRGTPAQLARIKKQLRIPDLERMLGERGMQFERPQSPPIGGGPEPFPEQVGMPEPPPTEPPAQAAPPEPPPSTPPAPAGEGGAAPIRMFKDPLDAAITNTKEILPDYNAAKAAAKEAGAAKGSPLDLERGKLGRGLQIAGKGVDRLENEATTQGLQQDLNDISELPEPTLKNLIQRLMKGEEGAIDQAQAMRLGLGAATGAAAGYSADPFDNKEASTLTGGLVGAFAPRLLSNTVIPKVASFMGNHSEGIDNGLGLLNSFHNTGLLSPLSVVKKAAGDIGGLSLAALKNPDKAPAILRQLLTREGLAGVGGAFKEGFTGPEQEAKTGIESLIGNGLFNTEGKVMGGLTRATKHILGESGFTVPEQRHYTLTAEPTYGPTKAIFNGIRSNKILQHFSPFARIGINRLERGWEHSPLGMLNAVGEKDPKTLDTIFRNAVTGTTVAGGAYALTPDDYVKNHPVASSVVASLGGPLGIPVLAGMAMKSGGASVPNIKKAFNGTDENTTFGSILKNSAIAGRTISQDIPGLRLIEEVGTPKGFLRNYFSGYTNKFRPLAMALSPEEPATTKGDDKNLTETQQIFNRMLSNIPGVRQELPRKKVSISAKPKFKIEL